MIYLVGLLFLLWCLTGLYLATQYQKLVQQLFEFREGVKSHVLENGTTDEKLYELVIESSRTILPSDHPVNLAKKTQ
nr:hypothetical protein [Alteromonas macleodii]|tara:strand:+ start:3076 stop:3306 length:231 start_codon:yes stop_codon:yes gene_type:complete